MCVITSASVLVIQKEATGFDCPHLSFMWALVVIYVGATKSSGLSVAIWLATHVLVVCTCIDIYASLGYTLSLFTGQIANRISSNAHRTVMKGSQDRLGFGYKEGGSGGAGTPGFCGFLNILNRFSALVAEEGLGALSSEASELAEPEPCSSSRRKQQGSCCVGWRLISLGSQTYGGIAYMTAVLQGYTRPL